MKNTSFNLSAFKPPHILCLATLLCSVDAQALPLPPPSPPPILNGTTDKADPATVLISATKDGTDRVCTGTVVSPHVVVTAAHCVDPARIGDGNTFRVFLGYDLWNSSQVEDPSSWIAVDTTNFHPEYDSSDLDIPHYDIGVVVTLTPLAIPPIPVHRDMFGSSLIGTRVRMIGYGRSSEADLYSIGVKREGRGKLAIIEDLYIQINDDKFSGLSGDSGGTVLASISDVPTLIGVISRGWTGETMAVRTDISTAYIDSMIGTYDPGFLPVPDGGTDGAPDASPDGLSESDANTTPDTPALSDVVPDQQEQPLAEASLEADASEADSSSRDSSAPPDSSPSESSTTTVDAQVSAQPPARSDESADSGCSCTTTGSGSAPPSSLAALSLLSLLLGKRRRRR